mmetsp:Transcript_7603/g.8289  ORF Transcript_7603/g.8289 Transcript_7603/m.8289 type:complete len:458 (+) Transcript_7603:59-1432(+)
MVSVFDGQLTRTWFFPYQGRNHVISLYHDTITGVRSAAVDHLEIAGSSGYSSVFMEAKGHRIFFTVSELPGYIEIKRAGWTGFSYSCVVNDKKLSESTEAISSNQDPLFRVKLLETTLTPDENSDYPITWYLVRTTRIADNSVTAVHRRFRDFAELNSQVKQNLKGHHLREIIPPLPEKPLKSLTDHRDPTFIQDRQAKLEIYLTALVAIPHVCDMICVKAFLGMMDQVREYSVSFHIPTLGLTLVPAEKSQADNVGVAVLVGSVQKPEVGSITPGDSISKINGVPIANLNFNGVINRVKILPRPIIIHFIQVIGGKPSYPIPHPPQQTTSASLTPPPTSITAPLRTPSEPLTAVNRVEERSTNPPNPPLQNIQGDEVSGWNSYHSELNSPAAPVVRPVKSQSEGHSRLLFPDDDQPADEFLSTNKAKPEVEKVNEPVDSASSPNPVQKPAVPIGWD